MTKTPPKKTSATAVAPPTTATKASTEWSDIAIAVQAETTADGIVNPFTKDVFVKAADGLLTVKRPASCPHPNGVKVVGSLAATFAKWYNPAAYFGIVTDADCAERFGIKGFKLPEIAVDPEVTPFGIVTAKLDGQEYAFLVSGGQTIRVGQRTDKSYIWAWPAKMADGRGIAPPRSTRCADATEAFRTVMTAFGGKMRGGSGAPAASKAPAIKTPTKPSKEPAKPSKAPPKKK